MNSNWTRPLGLGLSLGASFAFLASHWISPSEEPDLRQYREVRDFLSRSFVRDTSSSKLLDLALHGMAEGLDEYTRYYSGEETRVLERETGGRYTGIGAVFRDPVHAGQILFTLPGSPADRAGLRVGDRILSVDGKGLDELGEDGLRAALGGEEPARLAIGLADIDGRTRETSLWRTSIVDPTLRHSRMLDAEAGVGYLALNSFSHETLGEFDRALERLREQGAHALVLDLRGNPGGVLVAAVAIARRFVPEGLIVSTEGQGAPVEHHADPAQAWHQGMPLVVLVDDRSASASEVLAAALQDHRAAVVVGTPTYGKGRVQTMRRFPEMQAAAKVTTSYYYTPAHRNLDRSSHPGRDFGIVPDLVVPVSAAEARVVHAYLASYGAPAEALAVLRAWEQREGTRIVPDPPEDHQLAAALALMRGDRPVAVQEDP
jgi:carboxyl-terminal processing protease